MMNEVDTKTAQILVRISEEERNEWKRAAEILGKSMSELIRETVAAQVNLVLHCPHPLNRRRSYPWAEFCDACEERLSG